MRYFHKYFFTLFIILSASVSIAQVRFVGGTINQTEIWSDTVLVEDDIVVSNSGVLNISPGTKVLFTGPYYISVNGTGKIEAMGSQTDSIFFTAQDTTGFSNLNTPNGGWLGIDFGYNLPMNNQADTSRLSYCRISYVKGISGNSGSMRSGILISGFSKVLVDRCTVKNNITQYWSAGINIRSENVLTKPVISNCMIIYNHCFEGCGGGLMIRSYEASTVSPLIIGNTISGNTSLYGGSGVEIRSMGNNSTCSPELIGNTISDNSVFDADGGGVLIVNNYKSYCKPVLKDNIIKCNSAQNGGGMAITGSFWDLELTMMNNTIDQNTALENGGGICFIHGFEKLYGNISGNRISNNTANMNGGGIFMEASHVWSKVYPAFRENVITGNHSQSGGGVYCIFGEGNNRPDFISNIIKANSSDNAGGGLYFEINHANGIMSGVIEGNSIDSNNAAGAGGGIFWKSTKGTSNPYFLKNSIAYNSSGDDGGGIYIYADEGKCQTKLINNLVYSNIASDDGGGISIQADESDATGTIICNTVCSNSCGSKGGALFISSNNEASSCIFNTLNNIFRDNFNGPEENQLYLIQNFGQVKLDFNYNCTKNTENNLVIMGDGQLNFTGNSFDSTNIAADPIFVSPTGKNLKDGYSIKNEPDWSLNWNSPCIDHGILDTASLSIPDEDIMDHLRFYGLRMDIGAIESETSSHYDETGYNNELLIFPNPSSGLIQVKNIVLSGSPTWHLFDNSQKLLCSGKTCSEFTIDISNCPKGVYFLVISNRITSLMNRIVVL